MKLFPLLIWIGAAPFVSAQTPIKHLVVIFQENISFDHYFATYPVAANSTPGEPEFHAAPGTPPVNGLSGPLLTHNPNAAQPFRLSRAQAVTCDQDHGYSAEQKAFNHGLMNRFVESTGHGTGPHCNIPGYEPSVVMGYYDGNTVTAIWNYAQHFAMSDNSFGTTFGPSTPGALNLISGQTHGAEDVTERAAKSVVEGSVIADPDPSRTLDDCSNGRATVIMGGKNVGDLLNAKHITWGWFEGGFKPTSRDPDGTAVCGAMHNNIAGAAKRDYVPHHEPFQYYPQTANPHHWPPTSVKMIGHMDRADHQYDMSDFFDALKAGNLPSVSYLKAPAYQDGHAANSDPLDEQTFLVNTINALERSPYWSSTAIIISYDDSDGWYDHVMGPIVSRSSTPADNLTGSGVCGHGSPAAFEGRCGYGPRLPLMVISPYAKVNFVDHTVTDQSSILKFIEDNWGLGRIGDHSMDELAGSLTGMFDFHRPAAKALFLDPSTGEIAGGSRRESIRQR